MIFCKFGCAPIKMLILKLFIYTIWHIIYKNRASQVWYWIIINFFNVPS